VTLGTGSELSVEHLPPQLRGQTAPRPIRPRGMGRDQTTLCTDLVRQGISSAGPHANDLHDRIVGQVERELIQQVLQACDRIQIKAAARLGINRNTLHKKLAEYRLDEGDGGVSDPLATDSDRRNSNGSHGDADWDEDQRGKSPSQPKASAPSDPVSDD
jgi:two-component system response regulator AtoC